VTEASALDLEAALAAVERAEEDRLLTQVQGSARLELEYLRQLYPALIEYRGGLFVEERFDQAAVDDIFTHSGEAEPVVAAQKFVNAVPLAWSEEPFDPVLARAIGESLVFAWSHWVRDRFGREIAAQVDIGELEGAAWFRARL
jgi:hypothetical protein